MTISSLVFLAVFVALIVWVYLPSRKRYYELNARLPLKENDTHDK